MNWDRVNKTLTAAARIVVGAIFVYAGVGKFLTDSVGPTMLTEFFPPGSIGGYVAASAEILLGLWLVSGILRQWSAGIAIVTLLVFSGLIVREMNKPDPNPCGCVREVLPGGELVDRVAEVRRGLRLSLGRNVAMIGCAAMTLLVGGSGRGSSKPCGAVPAIEDRSGSPPADRPLSETPDRS